MDNDDRFRRQGYSARPVSVVGDADRIAMDRLQRPSQHGLLQRDAGPRDRSAVAATRDRTGLYAGTALLDLYRRMPRALSARDPSRRSRADLGLSARRR